MVSPTAGIVPVLRMLLPVCALSAMLSACDDRPEDYLPKDVAALPAPAGATIPQIRALRNALRNCERAMEAGSDQIAGLATEASAPATPEKIEDVRDACASSAKMIGGLPIGGRLKDPCMRAAYAREAVAAGALSTLASASSALGAEALRDRISDQVAASRACASEISAAEREAPA